MKSHKSVVVIGDISALPDSYASEIKLRAIRGEPVAHVSLGFLCHSGQGVSRDYINAIDCYENSAEQGLLENPLRLGPLHDVGKNISFACLIKS